MYTLANGWTIEAIMTLVKKRNTNRRCAAYNGACRYEMEDNHCLVGCFIPPEDVAMDYNGNVVDLLNDCPRLKASMPFTDIEALKALQSLHDDLRSDETVYDKVEKWLKANVKKT